MVNGHGYNGQQIDTICDTHRPCQMILKPVFADFDYSLGGGGGGGGGWGGYAYYFLRCLDDQIW